MKKIFVLFNLFHVAFSQAYTPVEATFSDSMLIEKFILDLTEQIKESDTIEFTNYLFDAQSFLDWSIDSSSSDTNQKRFYEIIIQNDLLEQGIKKLYKHMDKSSQRVNTILKKIKVLNLNYEIWENAFMKAPNNQVSYDLLIIFNSKSRKRYLNIYITTYNGKLYLIDDYFYLRETKLK